MKVYQIWYDRNVGPTFSSVDKALKYLGFKTVEELEQDITDCRFPHIETTSVDETDFMRDR